LLFSAQRRRWSFSSPCLVRFLPPPVTGHPFFLLVAHAVSLPSLASDGNPSRCGQLLFLFFTNVWFVDSGPLLLLQPGADPFLSFWPARRSRFFLFFRAQPRFAVVVFPPFLKTLAGPAFFPVLCRRRCFFSFLVTDEFLFLKALSFSLFLWRQICFLRCQRLIDCLSFSGNKRPFSFFFTSWRRPVFSCAGF